MRGRALAYLAYTVTVDATGHKFLSEAAMKPRESFRAAFADRASLRYR